MSKCWDMAAHRIFRGAEHFSCARKSAGLLSKGFRLQGRQPLGRAAVSSQARSEFLQENKDLLATAHAVTRCRKCFARAGSSAVRPSLLRAGLFASVQPSHTSQGEHAMRYLSVTLSTCLGAITALAVSAYADDLVKMSENPAEWVMPARTYDNRATRRSSRSTRATSASCRWRGRSRPASCAVTKARRW